MFQKKQRKKKRIHQLSAINEDEKFTYRPKLEKLEKGDIFCDSMCPAGNGTSTSENDELVETTITGELLPKEKAIGREDRKDETQEESDDETNSDAIVVSPTNSPLPSGCASLDDTGMDEIFEDAKAEPSRPIIAPSPSFVLAGLQKKATPLSLKSWTALALTLDGRDKITKVFQYASRFLAWWFAGNGSKHMALRFAELYKSLSMSRKAFRLGRSLIEIEKLRSIGLGQLLLWHLQQTLGLHEDVDHDENVETPKKRPPKTFARRASSNIGWGPMSLDDDEDDIRKRYRPSLARSLSMKAYRAIYRPLRSTLSSVMGDARAAPAAELWTVIGSAMKLLGLLGFWAGDNINYVSSTGFFDDHSLPTEERLEKRKQLQTFSGIRANQAYFGGSVAGLLVTAYSYITFRRDELAAAEQEWKDACEEGEEECKHALRRLRKAREKQFSLFLTLLKVSGNAYG